MTPGAMIAVIVLVLLALGGGAVAIKVIGDFLRSIDGDDTGDSM